MNNDNNPCGRYKFSDDVTMLYPIKYLNNYVMISWKIVSRTLSP